MSKADAAKEALLSAILSDPWTRGNYIKLIDHLRNRREEEDLEKFRELYAARFLPDAVFWRSWMADVVHLGTEEQVHSFFERSFSNCPDVDLACDYLSFIEKCVEEKDMSPSSFRRLLEPVLSTVGADLITGAEIWGRYRALEVEEFEDLIETSENPRSEEVVAAKTYIIRAVFTRQLGLPLLGNEKVLQEMETFLEEYCENSDIEIIQPDILKQTFDNGLEKRSRLIQFEDKLLAAADDKVDAGQRTVLWTDYIAFERTEGDSQRVIRLFERAIISLGCEINPRILIEEYAQYAVTQKDWKLLDSVTRRGTIVSYDSLVMWKYCLLAVELTNQSDEFFEAVHERCLSSGLTTPGDYLSALLLRSDFYRRRIVSFLQKESTDLTSAENLALKLRKSFEYVEQSMAQYYQGWVEGWLSILRYRVAVEDTLITELAEKMCEAGHVNNEIASASPDAWENFISKFGRICGIDIWKEYLNWALSVSRDLNVCRKILRKGLNLTASDLAVQEALSLELVVFEERNASSAEDVANAMVKATCRSNKIADERRAAQKIDDEKPVKSTSFVDSAALMVEDPSIQAQNSKRGRESLENSHESAAKRKRSNNEMKDLEQQSVNVPDADMKVAQSTAASGHAMSIYLKNVSFSATEEEILSLCRPFGEIETCDFLKSDAGKFKGMVCIHYKTPDAADNAIKSLHGHPVHNRKLTVELYHATAAITAKNSSEGVDSATKWHPTTVFASQLPGAFTDSDLKKYFEVFGAVRIARLLLDKHTGESKCRALIEFESPESVRRALDSRHVIGDRVVYVTRSKFPAAPNEVNAPANSSGNMQTKFNESANISNKSRGVAFEGSTDNGPEDKGTVGTLGLKPRVLKRKAMMK